MSPAGFRYLVRSADGRESARYLTSAGAAAGFLSAGQGAELYTLDRAGYWRPILRRGLACNRSCVEIAREIDGVRAAMRTGDWRPCGGCCGTLVTGADDLCWRCRADVPAVPA